MSCRSWDIKKSQIIIKYLGSSIHGARLTKVAHYFHDTHFLQPQLESYSS